MNSAQFSMTGTAKVSCDERKCSPKSRSIYARDRNVFWCDPHDPAVASIRIRDCRPACGAAARRARRARSACWISATSWTRSCSGLLGVGSAKIASPSGFAMLRDRRAHQPSGLSRPQRVAGRSLPNCRAAANRPPAASTAGRSSAGRRGSAAAPSQPNIMTAKPHALGDAAHRELGAVRSLVPPHPVRSSSSMRRLSVLRIIVQLHRPSSRKLRSKALWIVSPSRASMSPRALTQPPGSLPQAGEGARGGRGSHRVRRVGNGEAASQPIATNVRFVTRH